MVSFGMQAALEMRRGEGGVGGEAGCFFSPPWFEFVHMVECGYETSVVLHLLSLDASLGI